MKSRHQVFALAAGALLLASYAGAQTPSTSDQTRPGATSPGAASTPHQHEAMQSASNTGGQDPKTFVKKAALDGMTEVELGKIAQEKSQNADVRSFAAQMVADHSKANDELKSIAKKKGYEVPAKLDAEHKAMVTKLGGKSGADFDKAYAEAMDKDHMKAVALFTDAQKSSDSDLAAFAQKTLPTLEEHKQLADSLDSKTRSASSESKDKERAR
jgi:putative membrane protein